MEIREILLINNLIMDKLNQLKQGEGHYKDAPADFITNFATILHKVNEESLVPTYIETTMYSILLPVITKIVNITKEKTFNEIDANGKLQQIRFLLEPVLERLPEVMDTSSVEEAVSKVSPKTVRLDIGTLFDRALPKLTEDFNHSIVFTEGDLPEEVVEKLNNAKTQEEKDEIIANYLADNIKNKENSPAVQEAIVKIAGKEITN